MVNSPLRIDAVVFDGFEMLDLFGPLEFFSLLQARATIRLIGLETGLISASGGPRVLAEGLLEAGEAPDLLLIPGGIGTRALVSHHVFIDRLRAAAEASPCVATVCTGSALLARTGLLDGKKATTNKRAFDWVLSQGPAVNWQRAPRWVCDGKFWTSAGIAAGMDMTLAWIADRFGDNVRSEAARHGEYQFADDADFDPNANT